MSSPPVLDLGPILEPVSADQPAGEDLRQDASPTSVYYEIKDLRSTARAAERHALMSGDGDPPDWSPIVSLTPGVLANRSKDLELAAYLVEALVREHGFAGLRDGFDMLQGLIEQFADDLYPLPDEDGVSTRVAPMAGLNGSDAEGTLVRPIQTVPLTDRSSIGQFSTADYKQALELERLTPEQKQRRLDQGAVSLEMFRTAVAETESSFFDVVHVDLMDCVDAFKELTATADSAYGADSPPSSNVQHALDECLSTLEAVAGHKLTSSASDDLEDESGDQTGDTSVRSESTGVPGQVQTREEAFQAILRIAEFFRRTEPHSPLSYALERIVKWGQLPLPQLMRELLPDQSSMLQMFRLVGIPPDEGQND